MESIREDRYCITIPDVFYQKVLDVAREKKMFFYDLVLINIISLDNGRLSLIDLESVYDLDELYNLCKHNAKVKPAYYYEDLQKIWAMRITL